MQVSLHVEKYLQNNVPWVRPDCSGSNLALFKHCADGHIAVVEEEFVKNVEPIIRLHDMRIVMVTTTEAAEFEPAS